MFETTDVILQMLGIYLGVGFALGVLYSIFRFIRILMPKQKLLAALLDFIFAVLSGIILFIFSSAYGLGYFRLYYIAAAAVGFAANMLTLGFVVPPAAKLLRRLLRSVFRFISDIMSQVIGLFRQKTTVLFIKISENLTKIREKCKLYLKKHSRMLYNNNDHKIGEVYREGGETGNAIKAKVRKIG